MFYLVCLTLILLYLPGFFISGIFKIFAKSEYLEKMVLFFAMSFIWNTFVMAVGLATHLNINEVAILYMIGFLILIAGYFLSHKFIKFNFVRKINRDIFYNNLIWILPIVLGVMTIFVAQSQGTIFEEESFFHLAIIAKALSEQPLTTSNLSFIGTNILHPVYSFPLWHIYLTMISHLTRTNIFNIWNATLIPLTLTVMLIWAWLLKLIMPSKKMAALSLSFFAVVILIFNHSYLFERLAVPNTLGLFILMPILFGLALKYIFETDKDNKILIIFWLLLFFTSIIHILQFIYFGLIFFAFVCLMGFISLFQKDLRIYFQKAVLVLVGYIFLVLIVLLSALNFHLIDTQKLNIIFPNIIPNSSPTFNNLYVFTKIIFILFPFLLILTKKYPRLIFVLSLFLVLPIIYFFDTNFFQILFLKIFGQVFFSRLDAYVTWDFAIWGIILALFLSYFDIILDRFKKYQATINICLVLILITEILLETKYKLISWAYSQSFSNGSLTSFINNYYWILLSVSIVLVFLIYLWQIKINFDILISKKITHRFSVLILAAIILFFFFSPSFASMLRPVNKFDANHQYLDLDSIGGQSAISFINSQIPPKSRILAQDTASDYLPLLTDNFMAAYPRSAKQNEINQFFSPDISYNQKLDLLKKFKIDYVYLSPYQINVQKEIATHPENFNNIYNQNQTLIFKIKY